MSDSLAFPEKLKRPTTHADQTLTPDCRRKTIMASVDTFKTAVVRIRDILRGPGVGITGMDSMRHICLYLLSRYMTRAKVAALGVPEEFAWETLIETAQTKNGGVQKALDCFYHSEEDCLVRHFDRLFGTEKFSFDLKSPPKHKEILEILDAVQMANVDCQMDILGWVYEQHLKTGSTAARDLGQFFTDRFICEYMTELCRPGFKAAGVPESVCDPTMGTGGFLTAFIKHFKKHHADTPIDWAVQQKEIHGCDTDPKVAGVARLNLFMETGGNRTDNLLTHDSLYGDLTQTGYDVILANMPFGIKGIKHADCCERVKALKIRGTKSEPLFLQLMMVSLNAGGRCAVVVPDGMLVNISSCHNDTRKYLLDHFVLRRVIKMKGQFFMNTGIQPSILFFENAGRSTEVVEFWEVVRGTSGEITETLMASVPRTAIDATSSLDVRRYLKSEDPMPNSAGFPMVKLSDVCKVSFGDRINQKEHTGTKYPVYGSGWDTFKTDNFNRNGKTCKVGRFAISEVNMVMIVNGPYWLMDSGFTIESKKPETITTEFLWYCLLMDKKRLATLSTGSCQKNIDMDAFYKVEYSCPPLPIQQEIVDTLDRIYAPGTAEIADTLSLTNNAMDLVLAKPSGATLEPIVEAQRLIRKSVQMVADIKAQMAAIVRASCAVGDEMPLREAATLKYGYPFKSSDYTSEGLAVVKHTNLTDGHVFKSKKQDYIPSSAQTIEYNMVVGDIVISMDFDCGKVGMIADNGWVLNQRMCLARTTNPMVLRQEYLYWLLRFGGFYEKMQSVHTGTTIKHIRGTDIAKATIKVPHVDIQDCTLVRLTALQSQWDALDTLQKQSEDNARFILESYLRCPIGPSALRLLSSSHTLDDDADAETAAIDLDADESLDET